MRPHRVSREHGSAVGGVVMILATAIFCVVLSFWISLWAAIPIGIVMLSAWLFLSLRAGTSGLVRTVADGYYFYRRKGFSHQESIAREIADRYRFLGAGKDVQLALLLDERLDSNQLELDQVKEFVFLLFCVEHAFHPTADVRDRIWNTIDRMCNKCAAREGLIPAE